MQKILLDGEQCQEFLELDTVLKKDDFVADVTDESEVVVENWEVRYDQDTVRDVEVTYSTSV
jgi:hypothetical protein